MLYIQSNNDTYKLDNNHDHIQNLFYTKVPIDVGLKCDQNELYFFLAQNGYVPQRLIE